MRATTTGEVWHVKQAQNHNTLPKWLWRHTGDAVWFCKCLCIAAAAQNSFHGEREGLLTRTLHHLQYLLTAPLLLCSYVTMWNSSPLTMQHRGVGETPAQSKGKKRTETANFTLLRRGGGSVESRSPGITTEKIPPAPAIPLPRSSGGGQAHTAEDSLGRLPSPGAVKLQQVASSPNLQNARWKRAI